MDSYNKTQKISVLNNLSSLQKLSFKSINRAQTLNSNNNKIYEITLSSIPPLILSICYQCCRPKLNWLICTKKKMIKVKSCVNI